jgi:hypothetical protein
VESSHSGVPLSELPLPRTTGQLTEQVARFLAPLKDGPPGVREAMDGLGLKHRPTFLANYRQPALKSDLIQMTQPESPNIPTQKYRLAKVDF